MTVENSTLVSCFDLNLSGKCSFVWLIYDSFTSTLTLHLAHRWRNLQQGAVERKEEGLSHCVKTPVIFALARNTCSEARGAETAVGVRNKEQTGNLFKRCWTVLNHTCLVHRRTDSHTKSVQDRMANRRNDEQCPICFSVMDMSKLSLCLSLFF